MIPQLTIRRGRMRNMSGAKPGPSTSPPLVSTSASPRTKQHIMDEPNSRPVEPELLYEFVSMVLCTPNAQLVGLTVDAFQPLVHLEHFAEHRLRALLQPEQPGVAHAQQSPIQLDLD
jgi:hypothetical protein